MPVVFERSTTTNASPEEVWRVWTDVESWPEWTESVTSVEPYPGSLPLREGSVVHLEQPRLPAGDWTVSALEEGRTFSWTSAAPGMVTIASHEVVPEGAGARVTARLEMTGVGARAVRLLMGRLVRRYLELETAGVVRRAEGRG